ncbi:hypothetical protein KA005_24640, partial [bacterium]|nr:hypothetical protein [bacterium]
MEHIDKQKHKILVFGAEKKDISVPSEPILGSNYEISFETFEDSSTFDTFDGVILFQGLFEESRTSYDVLRGGKEYRIAKSGELDRRNNEISLLMKKKGFVCFILCQKFYEPYGEFRDTDCVKFWLNGARIAREDYQKSTGLIQAVRSEFKNFFDRYGRAFSFLRPEYNSTVESIELARLGSHTVGFIVANKCFFVPARIPEPSKVEDYFKKLSEAIISTRKKLTYSIPDWVKKYKFSQEATLLQRKKKAEKVMERVEEKLYIFERYKRVLVASGELLVNAVIDVLQRGFGFRAESCDELKEDIRIFDNEGNVLVLGEIKGVNTGVKRDYIYQAESHRERAKVSGIFPSILIINTHCKKAGSIEEKDCEVETEQVQLATNLNVLVLRALDFLRILELHLDGKITL